MARADRRTFHLPDALPALDTQVHGRFEPEPGIVAERVSYATLHGVRAPAILYLPQKRSGRIPALIVVNGHGGDKFTWYSFYTGMLYARFGAAVQRRITLLSPVKIPGSDMRSVGGRMSSPVCGGHPEFLPQRSLGLV